MIGALFIDASRCIGCRACVAACSECAGHGGESMIHLDLVRAGTSVQTAPTVCMHCAEPSCAAACPADAIKVDPEGIVLSALPERCIGCGNCALACPFGVPSVHAGIDLMRKCDLCYDRTATGLKPMCATVCPSGALVFGTRDAVEAHRRARPVSAFVFGERAVRTRNHVMAPAGSEALVVDGSAAVRSPAEQHLEEALWTLAAL